MGSNKIIEKISSEVLRLLREVGENKASCEVASYVVRLCVIDGTLNNEILEAEQIDSQTFQEYVDIVMKIILDSDSAFMAVAKLQVAMEMCYRDQELKMEKEYDALNHESDSMLATILSDRWAKKSTLSELEGLYEKIYEFVCKRAHLSRALPGAGYVECEAEVRGAIDSVFPAYGLQRFVALTRAEKNTQMEGLIPIIAGICLFNDFSDTGHTVSKTEINVVLDSLIDLGKKFDKNIDDKQHDALDLDAAVIGSEPLEGNTLGIATYIHQSLAYLYSLNNTQVSIEVLKSIGSEMEEELVQLVDVVGGNRSVPKEEVYPMLEAVGNLYLALIEEKRTFEAQEELYNAYMKLEEKTSQGMSSFLLPVLGSTGGIKDGSPRKLTRNNTNLQAALSVSPVLRVDEIPQGQRLSLGGFCIVTLVKKKIPVLHNKTIGYCVYSDKVYGFSSEEAIDSFRASPDKYISSLMDVITEAPLLVNLIECVDLLPLANIRDVLAGSLEGFQMCEFGTQTPTHFIEKHIDINYCWNEWVLRRRALAKANLRQKKTHSTQSILSHFRRENETQVWLPKVQETQTAVDQGQKMQKKMQYIEGLRGEPKTKCKVVSLSFDF